MSDISNNATLEIIEVPPELRGPSDEEILKISEKVLREVSGKRKKGERRPGKRVRDALKKEKALREAQKAAEEFFSSANAMAEPVKVQEPQVIYPKNSSFTGFMSSARVLKASFGTKPGEKPKAVIVSAAELAKQRAEERAKKIRDALMAKKIGAAATETIEKATPEAPPKRPRGRPRKNPV